MSILTLSLRDIYILRAPGPDKVGQTRDVAHMNPKSGMFSCQFLFLWHKRGSKHLGNQKLGTYHVGVLAEGSGKNGFGAVFELQRHHTHSSHGCVQSWIWIWQSCFECATFNLPPVPYKEYRACILLKDKSRLVGEGHINHFKTGSSHLTKQKSVPYPQKQPFKCFELLSVTCSYRDVKFYDHWALILVLNSGLQCIYSLIFSHSWLSIFVCHTVIFSVKVRDICKYSCLTTFLMLPCHPGPSYVQWRVVQEPQHRLYCQLAYWNVSGWPFVCETTKENPWKFSRIKHPLWVL